MGHLYFRWVASTMLQLVLWNEVISTFFNFSINSTSNWHCWRNCYKWRTTSQETMYRNNWKPGGICRNRSKESFTRCVLLQSSKINSICFSIYIFLVFYIYYWRCCFDTEWKYIVLFCLIICLYIKQALNKYILNEWMNEWRICL